MLSLVFVLALLAAACSSGGASPTATPQTTGAATPADAIKGFMDAAYTRQDASPYVCSTPNVADTFEVAAAASSAMQGASADTSGLTYTVKNQTADKATVTVAGQIVYTLLSNSTPVQFPTSDVNAVKEGGFWKFCGGAS